MDGGRERFDARFEAHGHALLKHKEDKWRLKGIMILRHFKSDANIELLKGLLADPAYAELHSPAAWAVGDWDAWALYWVRAEAYRTLTAWGVKVDRPILFKRLG